MWLPSAINKTTDDDWLAVGFFFPAFLEYCTMSKTPAVGIDLGTTYSCVGVFQHGKVDIIANDQGNRTTPSYVAFTDSERLIGDAAKNQVAMNPNNTIFGEYRTVSLVWKCWMEIEISNRLNYVVDFSSGAHFT